MTQLKFLCGAGIAHRQQQTLSLCKALAGQQQLTVTVKPRTYTTSANLVDTETLPKPISECPTLTPWEMLRGFLPGGKFYNKDLPKFIGELLEEKGNVIHLPGMFGKANLFLTQNPEDFEKVFRNEGLWPKRTLFEVLTYHREVHRKDFFKKTTGLVTSQGKEWHDVRSAINPILIHPKNVKVYLPILSKVNEEFIERIKAIRDPTTLEVPGNFKEEINRWTLESVSVVALDKQLGVISGENPEAKQFCSDLQLLFDLTIELEIKPSLWRQLPNRNLNRVMAMLDRSVAFTEKHVNEAMTAIEKLPTDRPESEKSVLEKLLKIDKDVAIVMAMDMMIAGVDTTSSTFSGLMLNLSKNPEKQQKLRQELLQILPKKDSPLTLENMKNLPYLRACLKESLRIYPLTSALLRTCIEDIVLSGYLVPKATDVIMVNSNLLDDSKHYSSPKEFIPERWLRQSTTNAADSVESCPHAAASKSTNPFVYLPFGYGPRSCVGRRIAEMELEIGIARIIRNFEVEMNYSVENAFKGGPVNTPNIPLKFKFTDINY